MYLIASVAVELGLLQVVVVVVHLERAARAELLAAHVAAHPVYRELYVGTIY